MARRAEKQRAAARRRPRPDADRRAAEEAALRACGVGVDEHAPAVLVPLAGRTPEIDLAIVTRLARTPGTEHAHGLEEIARGAEQRGWKAVAKEARRALYRFGQRGITLPERAPAAPLVRSAPTAALEGYVSAIDGRGDRLVWLVRAQREGGLVVLTGVLNEPAGLREIAIAELTRKKLRAMERDLREQHGLRMVPADGGYCDALLSQGFTRARAAGATGAGEFPTYRARLVTTDPPALEPPLFARVAGPADAADADALQHGAALLDEPEFATWHFDRSTLAPHLSGVAAARESPLVLSRPQHEERVRGVLARAVVELFSGPSAAVFRRRLEEMAYFLHATGRRARAAAAAGTARALAGAGDRGGTGIAFCEELVRRSLASHAAEDAARAKADAESSLIVRPGAAPTPRPRFGR